MGEPDGQSLDELIASVRAEKLVDHVRKRGRYVFFVAGGERFTLDRERAREFLAAILRVSHIYPTLEPTDPFETPDADESPV